MLFFCFCNIPVHHGFHGFSLEPLFLRSAICNYNSFSASISLQKAEQKPKEEEVPSYCRYRLQPAPELQ